ncbi:glucose-6-phosphate isomerase [Cyclonatronum proteinivorum]|uniref:Glucose-6-phosphate isomerase n=1 Tax=Cyclonatronum proteinivorum TaxID=1457365 RepID=A0A345UM30_9BACT|nr:glucose-6-phosphate isomerase [Cyclonatronum proteinivorum]AXJ01532.1 glucose-6-phosphate isomerase [Cyclonatronum proteinivorum]
MIRFDFEHAHSFVSDDALSSAKKRAEESFKQVQTQTGPGPEWLGWRSILAQPNDALLSEIDGLATAIRQEADVFIVCGIGGSYLGAKAVIDALCPFFGGKGPEILYAGHHMSGRYLSELMEYLKTPKADGTTKKVFVNVISKSGTTTETALAFRVIRSWIHETFEQPEKHIICTTSATGGALNKIIDANGYKKFVLPDDVGGRFSVLTPVGLLPIAVAGIDIRALFYGAVSAFNETEQSPDALLTYAATRLALYEQGKMMDMIASFEPELSGMGGWMQQLYGESEGKNGKGMFPVLLGYSTDLHSVGQMVQEGQRNMIETFLVVDKPGKTVTVAAEEDDADGLNYLSGKDFHYINGKAYLGTREAHVEGGVPCLSIHFEKLDEEHIGRFIYLCEIAIAVYVYCLNENPFDQPGVEAYKKAMFRLLGKPGF